MALSLHIADRALTTFEEVEEEKEKKEDVEEEKEEVEAKAEKSPAAQND